MKGPADMLLVAMIGVAAVALVPTAACGSTAVCYDADGSVTGVQRIDGAPYGCPSRYSDVNVRAEREAHDAQRELDA